MVTLRDLATTLCPSKVALYTSEKPPKANGVAPDSSSVVLTKKEEGRMPKLPHNFLRYFK